MTIFVKKKSVFKKWSNLDPEYLTKHVESIEEGMAEYLGKHGAERIVDFVNTVYTRV